MRLATLNLHRTLDAFLNAEVPILTKEGMIKYLKDRYAGIPLPIVDDPTEQVGHLNGMHARITNIIQENTTQRAIHQQKIDANNGEQVDRDFVNYYDNQSPKDVLALTYIEALKTVYKADSRYSIDGPPPAPEAAMTPTDAVEQQDEFRTKTEQQLFTILETEDYVFGLHLSNIMDRVYYLTRSQHWLKADISKYKDELEANPTDQRAIYKLNQAYTLYAAACALKAINLAKPEYSVLLWPAHAFDDYWTQIVRAAGNDAKRALIRDIITRTNHEITALQLDLATNQWPSHKAKQNAKFDLFAKQWLARLLFVENTRLRTK